MSEGYPVNLSAKVQLHDIVILQNSVVASVGCVVCCTVIEGAPRREGETCQGERF